MGFLRHMGQALRQAEANLRTLRALTIAQAALIEQLRAQLRASRAEHDNVLRRCLAVEHDYEAVCHELVHLKAERARIPWAAGRLVIGELAQPSKTAPEAPEHPFGTKTHTRAPQRPARPALRGL